ncbi:MAG TPA: hypothetical protein VGK73_21280 [Polyangiaceae bacterium]
MFHQRQAVVGASVLSLSVVGLVLSACGAEPMGDEGSEPVGRTAEPLVITDEFEIVAGDPNLVLAPYSSSLCVLTAIGGGLVNSGGWQSTVDIWFSGGAFTNWLLSSFGPASDPANPLWARARCVTGLASNQKAGPYIWAQGDAAVDMGASSARACFLTSVYGKYNGNGEQVRTRVSNGRWILDGTAGTAENYRVGGRAYCLSGFTRTGELSVSPPANDTAVTGAPLSWYFGNEDSDICGLTRVRGKFNAQSDYLKADFTFLSGTWFLSGSSSASPISGSMVCTVTH